MACTVDFRNLDEGFGGKTYKRKRIEQEQEQEQQLQQQQLLNDAASAAADSSMDIDDTVPPAPASKRQAVASSEDPNKPVLGKPTYDGVIAGKVSGRKWKEARTRRASAVKASLKRTTLERRMKEKEIKKAYKERMTELKEEIRQNKMEKRKKREEREKRKQENILKSGTKFQKITNPNTLKKIAKSKDKHLLKVVPDDLLRGNSKSKN